ncbi:hypothetical protein F0562_015691 [Nyssa sinensis]|uniref:Arabinogalactan peptide 23-like n=1 Tax=Nyssa sinensis TaxID=561372 RepID=A0A5J4ZLR9_9ASTE|nr:hypothetical protein F0562_015691 [Nyssa sinensis]
MNAPETGSANPAPVSIVGEGGTAPSCAIVADAYRSAMAMARTMSNYLVMDMKKISCAVLIAAASMSAALASEQDLAPAPGPAGAGASGSTTTLPFVGSLAGASLLSFIALYFQ